MHTEKKPFSTHSFALALAPCALAVFGVSSVALFLAPNCVMARLTGWTFLGIGKDSWEALSTGFGFVAVALALVYLGVHWRQITSFFRAGGARPTREVAVAVVLSFILAASSLGDVGPFAALMRWHEAHKHGRTAGAATQMLGDGSCGGVACGDHGASGGCGSGGCDEGGCGDHGASGGCGCSCESTKESCGSDCGDHGGSCSDGGGACSHQSEG